MVPQVLVQLERAAVDGEREGGPAALPAPEWSTCAESGADRAARTPVEEVLAGIWSGVLGVERWE